MRILLTVAISLAVAGCAAPAGPKLVQKTDPYNKAQQYAFGPVATSECPGAPRLNGDASLKFLGADDLHAMVVGYGGYGWMFLQTTAPIDILIDGKAEQLKPVNSSDREVVRGGYVTEDVYYPVKKDFVQRLAAANQVRFRVLGSKGTLERCMNAAQLSTINAVVPLVP